MPLTRLKNEYLEEDGVRFLMADEVGNTVTCRVTHEALRDHANRPRLLSPRGQARKVKYDLRLTLMNIHAGRRTKRY
jgi:hypothetical protein